MHLNALELAARLRALDDLASGKLRPSLKTRKQKLEKGQQKEPTRVAKEGLQASFLAYNGVRVARQNKCRLLKHPGFGDVLWRPGQTRTNSPRFGKA